jgi:S-formylglutathione hydrolase FrmB
MRRLPTYLLLLLAVACGGGTTEPVLGRAPDDFRAAPAAARLAGQSVSIEPFLWRDFQPISPPDGKPLTAVVRVRAAGGATLAAEVTADSLWVISGDQAWAARAVQEQPRSATGAYLEVVARNGPKWGPGVRVDVVVRVRDGGGAVAYVRAADQLIGRTD